VAASSAERRVREDAEEAEWPKQPKKKGLKNQKAWHPLLRCQRDLSVSHIVVKLDARHGRHGAHVVAGVPAQVALSGSRATSTRTRGISIGAPSPGV
jgi:hypothetical protein